MFLQAGLDRANQFETARQIRLLTRSGCRAYALRREIRKAAATRSFAISVVDAITDAHRDEAHFQPGGGNRLIQLGSRMGVNY